MVPAALRLPGESETAATRPCGLKGSQEHGGSMAQLDLSLGRNWMPSMIISYPLFSTGPLKAWDEIQVCVGHVF